MSAPTPIAFAEALAKIRQVGAARRVPSETRPLREALGAVLAEDIVAPIDLPPFDNSAMDGFAFAAASLDPNHDTWLTMCGEQYAGPDRDMHVALGQCVRITTGAPIPKGTDTVAIKESVEVAGSSVRIPAAVHAGANVRRRGGDVRLGEHVLQSGRTLRSVDLGMISALGRTTLMLARRPAVAVFTSGDELREGGVALSHGEIHDSNRTLLQAMLAEEGIATLAWPALPDDAPRIRGALADAANAYDLILTCGGVSAGEKDLIPALLADHGLVHFWKVRMRPGMPVLFGEWDRALVLGLPGNPVSVLATFRRLVLPLLDAMQGRKDRAAPLRARLLAPVGKSHDRLEFRRARLVCDDSGQLGVLPHLATGSHQQRGAVESNALMFLPEDVRDLEVGDLVETESYGAILRT